MLEITLENAVFFFFLAFSEQFQLVSHTVDTVRSPVRVTHSRELTVEMPYQLPPLWGSSDVALPQ